MLEVDTKRAVSATPYDYLRSMAGTGHCHA
jgi:hypothetical protein